jgi:hypothetical protein
MGALEIVSEITELNELSSYIQDEQVDKAMEKVVQLVVNPVAAADNPAKLIVGLQALSAVFAMKATYYKTLDTGRTGSDQAKKKNIYYTMSDSLDRLVDALKYMART